MIWALHDYYLNKTGVISFESLYQEHQPVNKLFTFMGAR